MREPPANARSARDLIRVGRPYLTGQRRTIHIIVEERQWVVSGIIDWMGQNVLNRNVPVPRNNISKVAERGLDLSRIRGKSPIGFGPGCWIVGANLNW